MKQHSLWVIRRKGFSPTYYRLIWWYCISKVIMAYSSYTTSRLIKDVMGSLPNHLPQHTSECHDITSCDGFVWHIVSGKVSFWSPCHDDVIKWKYFPRYWPFVRGIHRSPVNSLHKGQWRGALMISLICDWINSWVNHREAGYLRRHCAHYVVTVMVMVDKKVIS